MFEGVHDEDGEAQSEDVGQEAGVEIRPAVLLQAVGRAALSSRPWTEGGNVHGTARHGGASPDVEAQQQSDEDSRDDDVTQTQHGEVTGVQSLLQQVLRKHH